ncbi:hypothetical protein Aph02nite_05530 [Actinoplanes philippinensis]|uniref:Uncharacterized protein n=1 Tax=Actinoplanes philippinensis TaxID=35752 RepID=A0A1I2CY12_9ACTN|nr:hypothetical protein [Actinoplanes philippinensis]GIE74603.1 hypothetical protein Aph02nite_05530 [Actinoplanes philippinensis]SFE73207.1 hypothetical protein SAMN05421541_103279 [Actinoplanes philippinensis]
MTPARLLAVLAGVPGLHPHTDQRVPPTITWDDGPSGRTAAAAVAAAGFTVTEPFWAGALVDVGVEPCVFQRVLRPETAALLWLHSTEPDTPGGDAALAQRVFAADLPAEGHRPATHTDELAVHLLIGELSGTDFGGDDLFTRMGATVRRIFGGRPGLVELAGRAVI